MYIMLKQNENTKANIEKILKIYGDKATLSNELFISTEGETDVLSYVAISCYSVPQLRLFKGDENVEIPLTDLSTIYELD